MLLFFDFKGVGLVDNIIILGIYLYELIDLMTGLLSIKVLLINGVDYIVVFSVVFDKIFIMLIKVFNVFLEYILVVILEVLDVNGNLVGIFVSYVVLKFKNKIYSEGDIVML